MRDIYSADFETNNSEVAISCKRTTVWLADIYNPITRRHYTTTSIHDFFKQLLKLGGGIYYFHNLKFDGQFILHYILRNGYKYTNAKKINVGEFYSLISDRGVYYMIKVAIGYYRGKKVICEFRDSSKKINGSVEQIANDYKLPIKKGSIDYNAHHEKSGEVSTDDIDYIHGDTEIIGVVLLDQHKLGMTKLTTSSDSLGVYKDFLRGNYRNFFPVVDYETDCFFRSAYRGGVVQVNEHVAGLTLNTPIYAYDVNSMYPSVMATAILPYGIPKKFNGKPKPTKAYPIYIVEVEVCFDLKKGHRPTLLRKSLGFKKIEYVSSTHGEVELFVVTSVDLALLFTHYEIHEIHYNGGYYFHGSTKLFTDFIKPLYKQKCESTGAVKAQAKLILNSLYGKFGTNPKHVERIPYLNGDVLTFKNGVTTIEEPEYTAMAAFITAYARKKLFESIHDNIDSFIYCDTDSIHITAMAKNIEIDDVALGCWSLEKIYVKSRYLAQKTYMGEKENGERDIKICGAPKSIKQLVTFDNFAIGMTYDGKLTPRKVKGGVVLVDTTFTIKER